jgi:magnesium transporter
VKRGEHDDPTTVRPRERRRLAAPGDGGGVLDLPGQPDPVPGAAEWSDSLRDLVTTILETNLTIQGNRLNIVTKKVTGWAAIIAIPTLITGYFGMNVPYPGFGEETGFAASITTIALTGLVLYLIFKRKDWL